MLLAEIRVALLCLPFSWLDLPMLPALCRSRHLAVHRASCKLHQLTDNDGLLIEAGCLARHDELVSLSVCRELKRGIVREVHRTSVGGL